MTGSVKGVGALLGQVANAAERRRRERVHLLGQLAPRLQAARRVEAALDRQLARRFNVFRYVRTDELGLSRIIADLLDPCADHGQGQATLEAMLEALPATRRLAGSIRASANNPIRVETERPTDDGGRIDISVEIPTGEGRFCLAFENKPYAGDQRRQVLSYLQFLDRQGYEEGFLLVYVPPVQSDPSDYSFPEGERPKWEGRFTVMPYVGGQTSLESWIGSCRRDGGPPRLNWFLRQAQEFCRMQFGESNMTADAETREIRQYLLQNPELMQAAAAVHEAWPVVVDEVCERFLRNLRAKVEHRLGESKELERFAERLRVRHEYGGAKQYSNLLLIGLMDRPRYEIGMQSHARHGLNGWLWGVRAPQPFPKMTEPDQEYCRRFSEALRESGLTLGIVKEPPWQWPQYEDLPRFRDWIPLVPELHRENEDGGGEITDFCCENLLEIAGYAIPALDRTP